MNETDPAFPTGPWTGFFTYFLFSRRDRTDLVLEFSNGKITGEGGDAVGSFVISGDYNVQTRVCSWRKSYVGQHDVWYEGVRRGKGITGTWHINADWSGGFEIWPITEDGQVLEADREQEPFVVTASPLVEGKLVGG